MKAALGSRWWWCRAGAQETAVCALDEDGWSEWEVMRVWVDGKGGGRGRSRKWVYEGPLLMGTTVHSQPLGAHVVRLWSTTELMCLWVSLTRFTSGRSGIAVPPPTESLYLIYPTEGSVEEKWKGRKRSGINQRQYQGERKTTQHGTTDTEHGIKHTFFPEKWRSVSC